MRAHSINTGFVYFATLVGVCFSAPPIIQSSTSQVENVVGIKSEANSDLNFYEIDGSFTKVRTTTVPFQTKAPYMVFNSELNKIEVFGDWRTAPRTSHQASLHHYFYDYEADIWTDNTLESLYEGENQGVALYTNEAGTILLNGWSWTYKKFISDVYQVTLPLSASEPIELPNLPIAMDNFGAKYYNSKIYVSGGYYQESSESFVTEIYPTSLFCLDMQNNQYLWMTMKSLSKPGMPLEVEIFNGILYAFNGISDLKVYNVGVETYDLTTGETQYIDNVLNYGRYHGAFILTNSTQGSQISTDENPMLTLIGGEVYPDCKTDSTVACNIAEQGTVGFKDVNKFNVLNNPEFTQYEAYYLASVKFFKN